MCAVFASGGGGAGLVVATCYAGLWFGPLAIFDPVLTFCMTFGMYAWARAFFQESQSPWYAVGFLAFALGAMVKNLHAVALPSLVFGLFLWVLGEYRVYREKWFWIGVGLCVGLVGGYFIFLGPAFWQHYFWEENIQRMVSQAGDKQSTAWQAYWGNRPLQWYAYVLWFDVFPWSFLFPLGLWWMWSQRPWRSCPQELFALLWFTAYFLALSLVPEKHERYLLPLLPAVGLVVGYVYDAVFRCPSRGVGWKALTGLLGLLGVVYVAGLALGPLLLHNKWNVPLEVFPLGWQVGLGIVSMTLVGLAWGKRYKEALIAVGVMGLALLFTVTGYIIPAIHAGSSPRFVLHQARQWLPTSEDPILSLQHWDWRSDEDEFYWDNVHGFSSIVAEDLDNERTLHFLNQEVTRLGQVQVMATGGQFRWLIAPNPTFETKILRSFFRSKKDIYFLSLQKKPGSVEVQEWEG